MCLLDVHLELQSCAVGLLVHLGLVRLEEGGHAIDTHETLHQQQHPGHVDGAEVHGSVVGGRGRGRGGKGDHRLAAEVELLSLSHPRACSPLEGWINI